MKNKLRRIMSIFLVFIMLVGVMPMYIRKVEASSLSDAVGLEFLFKGFDVLSGKDFANNTLTNARILKADSDSALKGHFEIIQFNTTSAKTSAERSIVEYAISEKLDMSVSTEAGVDYGKLFKASAKTKFGLNMSTAYKSSYDSYFFQSTVTHTETKHFINDIDSTLTKKAIQDLLNPDFLNALKNAKDIKKDVFEKYGTHFVTSYAMGGWIESSILATSEEEEFEEGVEIAFETAAEASGLGASVKAAIGLKTDLDTKTKTKKIANNRFATAVGGSGGIILGDTASDIEKIINDWTKTFTRSGVNTNGFILTDENLILTGIWELLPEGYEDRYYELMIEYIELSMEQDINFLNDFLYKSDKDLKKLNEYKKAHVDDLVNLSDYAVGDIKSISSPAEFALIGSTGDSGEWSVYRKYSLTKDIDFKGFKGDPSAGLRGKTFKGVFDGNGYTISNYSDIKNDNITINNGFASNELNLGMFPINGGTIKNFTVKNAGIIYGKEDYTSKESRSGNIHIRAGTIAGQNLGIIENVAVINDIGLDYGVRISYYCGGSADRRLHVGGIAGANGNGTIKGVIRNCNFTLNGNDRNSTIQTDNNITYDIDGLPQQNKAAMEDAGVWVWTRKASSSGSARAYVGGIVGTFYGGKIEDCYNLSFTRSVATNYARNGGIVGLVESTTTTNDTIERCYSNGRLNTKSPGEGTAYEGLIVGNYAGEAKFDDCFRLNTTSKPNIGSGDVSVIHIGPLPIGVIDLAGGIYRVSSFKIDTVKDALSDIDIWDNVSNSSYPVHVPKVKSIEIPTFTVEYQNGEPNFLVGDILDTANLSQIMKVSFTSSPGKVPLKEITTDNDLKILYNFGNVNSGAIYFLYTVGSTIYIGELKVPLGMYAIGTEDPTRISLNRNRANMRVGMSIQLIATLEPKLAKPKVDWNSSDIDVATVNEDGVVTAISEGTTSITVSTADGNFTDTCIITVDSDENDKITVGQTFGSKGGTVTVPVVISDNPGLADVTLTFQYDTDLTLLEFVSNGETMNIDNVSDVANRTVVLSNGTTTGFTGDTLLYLRFQISPDATLGNKYISISSGGASDKNTNNLAISFESGHVEVIDFLYGDVNGNGEVLTNDLTILRRHFANWPEIVIYPGADVNGDGKVLTNDLTILRRYFANWPGVVLGLNQITPSSAFSLYEFTVPRTTTSIPTITIATIHGQKGETVDVAVTIEGNPGLADVALEFQFDNDLTLREFITDNTTMTLDEASDVKNKTVLLTNATSAGFTGTTLVILRFDVSETAADGMKEISVTTPGLSDKDANNVNAIIINGGIMLVTPDMSDERIVQPETTEESLLKMFETGTTIENQSGTAFVGTGAVIIFPNGDRFTVIVHGDTTGDGIKDIEDAKRFLEHLVGNNSLDRAFEKAAEDYLNEDSALKSLRKFLNFVMTE